MVGSEYWRKGCQRDSTDFQLRPSGSWGRRNSTTQKPFEILGAENTDSCSQLIVAYFLYTELFASDSKTRQFNAAVNRIKADSRCVYLLGDVRQVKAYGEPTTNKWARARPLASSTVVDRQGVEHFRMHFHVEGPDNKGVVTLHMVKRPGESQLQYETFALDVRGHPTIYLENANEKAPKKAAFKLFGINLG